MRKQRVCSCKKCHKEGGSLDEKVTLSTRCHEGIGGQGVRVIVYLEVRSHDDTTAMGGNLKEYGKSDCGAVVPAAAGRF